MEKAENYFYPSATLGASLMCLAFFFFRQLFATPEGRIKVYLIRFPTRLMKLKLLRLSCQSRKGKGKVKITIRNLIINKLQLGVVDAQRRYHQVAFNVIPSRAFLNEINFEAVRMASETLHKLIKIKKSP